MRSVANPFAAGNNVRTVERDFTRINNELIRSHMAELSRVEIGVYLVLALRAINKTQTASVDQKYIAKVVRCTPRAVQKALERLAGRGLIGIESGKSQGQANNYVLLQVPAGRYVVGDIGGYEKRRGGGTNPASYKNKDKTKPKTESNQTIPQNPAEPSSPGRAALLFKVDRLRKAIEDHYHPGKTPWSARALSMLRGEVERIPMLTVEQWLACVENRYAFADVFGNELPETFIPLLVRYISAPLDQYRKPS